jgi:hypothetical protein
MDEEFEKEKKSLSYRNIRLIFIETCVISENTYSVLNKYTIILYIKTKEGNKKRTQRGDDS